MKTNGHENIAEPVIANVAARAHKAVDRAHRTASRAATRATGAVQPGVDLLSQSCDYVSANPLKAVGVAVVAGFVLAKILL